MSTSRLKTALGCAMMPLLAFALPADAQRVPGRFADEDLIFARPVPQPQINGDVVGVVFRNNSRTDFHDQPISFGQVFVAGKVPRGSGLTARAGNTAVAAQIDAKAFNPDGSVRMAVVTVQTPSLSRGSRQPVMLSLGPPQNGEVSLASLPNYNLIVEIAVHGGATYHLDAAQLLASTLAAKSPSYWLRGPLATEIRVDKPVVGSLHVTFDIRGYANGGVLTDVEFKNDYALQAQGGPLTYDVTITNGRETAFSQKNVLQRQYTHWHKLVGHGGPDEVSVAHDVAQLERTNAILDYDLTAGVQRNLILRNLKAMEGDGFGILQNAGFAWYMGQTGGRGDIGPTTQANTIWLVTQDEDAQSYALAQADAGGSIPWHFFDATAKTFLNAKKYPDLWTDERFRINGLRGLTQNISTFSKECSCFYLDTAHEPDATFIPFILTGERYYLDQLEAQASWDVMGYNPKYRLFEKGIVFFPDNQQRGMAWAFRGIINAAWIAPDDDPLKRYFAQIQANNLDYLLKEVATLHEGEASGWIPGAFNSSASGQISPWQQDFIAYIMTLAAKRGDPQALKVLNWQTNFLAGRFLAESKGLSPFDAAGYRMLTYGPPNQISGAHQTWAQIGRATVAGGFTAGGADWPKDTYQEYLQAAKGVLAGIVHITGSADARKAYQWLDQNAAKADITKDRLDPTWRVALPR
jgi:hypothetical protein